MFEVVGYDRPIPFTEITGFPHDPEGDEDALAQAAELAMEVDSRIKGYKLVGERDEEAPVAVGAEAGVADGAGTRSSG